MKLFLRAVAVVTACLTIVFFAGPAQALSVYYASAGAYTCGTGGSTGGWYTGYDQTGSVVIGRGCVNGSGNVGVTDSRDDSQRVAVLWRKNSDTSVTGLCIWTGGYPNTGKCSVGLGYAVAVKVGRCNGSVSACNTFADYETFGPWYSVL